MSESAPIDPDVELLARVAALDMSAIEFVHAELLAAAGTSRVDDLARSYQRTTRSLRQTLALKAKLTQAAASEATRQRARALLEPAPINPATSAKLHRIYDLQDAMARVAHAAGVRGEPALDALFERLDIEIDDWTERPDFATADIDEQVREACRRLDLPEGLADVWDELPLPDQDAAPWTPDASDVPPDRPSGQDAPAASAPQRMRRDEGSG